MKKRGLITIDEYMSMTEQELNDFLDRQEQLLGEGIINGNQQTVDLMGMSDEDIARKYGYTPINVVYDRIMKKLNR